MYGSDQSHYEGQNVKHRDVRSKLESVNITHLPSVDNMMMD